MLGVLLTVPIFTALESVRDPIAAFVLVMAALLIVTGYTSINAVVKAELFPAHIRALGVALPYALANTMFGGTAEYVALWFKDQGMERGFYWYVTAMIGLSLIVYLTDARHQAAQPDPRGLAVQPQQGGQEEKAGPAAGGKEEAACDELSGWSRSLLASRARCCRRRIQVRRERAVQVRKRKDPTRWSRSTPPAARPKY